MTTAWVLPKYVGPETSSSLDEAGFGKADILWKRFNFAVYVGVKI
ncbi:MAG: hypothetical protein ABIF04_01270 [Chloroflexota bacterium]